MTFCKFSPSFSAKNQTMIDNAFITEFLPKAPDLCVKAYILGLYKCSQSDDKTNSLEYFAKTLNVCEEDVESLFKYWEDMGLVQVLSTNPIEVRYLPINSTLGNVKKFQVDKYTDFNIQAQELLGKRMIMPNEFVEFYNLIENKHIEQSALLRIIKYCVELKGFNISPNYCIAVARDWQNDGIVSLTQVEEKIEELGVVDDKMSLILSAMGTKRKIQLEDKELLNKWLSIFGFELNVILFVVKTLKNKKRKLDVNVLDKNLTKYYEMKLMSVQEIENYENEKENLYFVAIAVNQQLGIHYDDLTKEIDTYVVPWVNMGFDVETLKLVADNCFKSSIKTLEGFNNIVTKLFKLGIVSLNSYMQYISDSLAVDEKIKKVLESLNLERNVNNMDRSFYSTWVNDWGFTDDIVLYGASLSKDKSNALQYLNKILSNWNAQGIKTLEKAQNTKVETSDSSKFIHNNYTKEQISSLIANLDEVEV
ncbi:MAG: DnaD domain protein [Clostridia bacterium]|nr:DnaD domain protein [Clostridia bacterium]